MCVCVCVCVSECWCVSACVPYSSVSIILFAHTSASFVIGIRYLQGFIYHKHTDRYPHKRIHPDPRTHLYTNIEMSRSKFVCGCLNSRTQNFILPFWRYFIANNAIIVFIRTFANYHWHWFWGCCNVFTYVCTLVCLRLFVSIKFTLAFVIVVICISVFDYLNGLCLCLLCHLHRLIHQSHLNYISEFVT